MDVVYIRLESARARQRVDDTLGRKTPWVCGLTGKRRPRAACTTVSQDEWATLRECIDRRGWAGIHLCTTCPMRAPYQQRFLFA